MPAHLRECLDLLGRAASVIHGARADDPLGGGDIDVAVSDLDPLWPLRLRSPWRLCQRWDYDTTGRSWVLESDSEVLAIDTLDDPKGVGRLRLPTGLLTAGKDGHVAPAARAAYLTSKRLRKGSWDPTDWARVRSLAADDPTMYTELIRRIAGPAVGDRLAAAVLAGRVPDVTLRRRWRIALRIQQAKRPRESLANCVQALCRICRRIARPTGLTVLVVGPDGAGKSSVAAALAPACERLFRRSLRTHWRPGLLPRPGGLTGRAPRDVTMPHGAPAHARLLSLALLGYFWLDFALGAWLRYWPARVRSGLVVVERGWWDIAVDPRRYRLRVAPRLVLALGRLLPKPDLVLRIEAPPSVVVARKPELSEAEVARQLQTWGRIRCGRRVAMLDGQRPLAEVIDAARGAVVETLEARAVARLGAGWAALPSKRSAYWLLPRGPRRAAETALGLYQPVTRRSLVGWHAARLAARAGAFRLLPRGEAPPREVRRLVAPYLPPRATLAVARARHAERYLVLVVEEAGTPALLVKVALDRGGRAALAREADALRTVGPRLVGPLVAPRLLTAAPGVLVQEFLPWKPRLRPWVIPPEVAAQLGCLYRELGGTAAGGPAHGDFAPWNLLRTEQGWALVDWEDWRGEAEPLADLAHYVGRSTELLKRPRRQALERALAPGGELAQAVKAYAEAAGLDPEAGLTALRARLEAPSAA